MERPTKVRNAQDASRRDGAKRTSGQVDAQDANRRDARQTRWPDHRRRERLTKVRNAQDARRRDGAKRTGGQVVTERSAEVRDARGVSGRRAQDATDRAASKRGDDEQANQELQVRQETCGKDAEANKTHQQDLERREKELRLKEDELDLLRILLTNKQRQMQEQLNILLQLVGSNSTWSRVRW